MRLFRRVHRVAVTLYGKPGCHLCEDALILLERLGKRYSIEVKEIDITSDPELYRRYDIFIPVVVIDDGEELTAPIQKQELRRALRRRRSSAAR